MEESDKPSRLDKKIAREARSRDLLRNLEPTWEALEAAVRATCEKLNKAYHREVHPKLNDRNTLISVSRQDPVPNESSFFEWALELRFYRDESRVVARTTKRHSRQGLAQDEGNPRSYVFAADLNANSAAFSRSGKMYSAIEVAEHEIAETFLGMDLDS